MQKGYYGKEPFDLRLTVLRMLYRLPVITAVTLLGSLLFGGGYYVKNILLRGEVRYSVTSQYRVEYAVEEEKDVGTVHINQTSWNTYLQTELFLNAVRRHLTEMSGLGAGSIPDNAELGAMLEAVLASDLRVLATVVTGGDPERSILIAKAVEAALTEEFAEAVREVVRIDVIDPGESALQVIPDVRPVRAFVLSGILSCFCVVILLLLKELGDDSIRLPSSLWRRYGLKTAGTLESRELTENLKYFFREEIFQEGIFQKGKGNIMLCTPEEGMNLGEVLEALKEKCPETVGEGWGVLPGDGSVFSSGACERLRNAGGILLVVRAGSHKGRKLERALEYLEQQDCQVTAALLWGADERLIRWYYAGERVRRQ